MNSTYRQKAGNLGDTFGYYEIRRATSKYISASKCLQNGVDKSYPKACVEGKKRGAYGSRIPLSHSNIEIGAAAWNILIASKGPYFPRPNKNFNISQDGRIRIFFKQMMKDQEMAQYGHSPLSQLLFYNNISSDSIQ